MSATGGLTWLDAKTKKLRPMKKQTNEVVSRKYGEVCDHAVMNFGTR